MTQELVHRQLHLTTQINNDQPQHTNILTDNETGNIYKPKLTFKSFTVFNFDFFFSFCTLRETINIFSYDLQNTSLTLKISRGRLKRKQ